jgi:hypothetical protein
MEVAALPDHGLVTAPFSYGCYFLFPQCYNLFGFLGLQTFGGASTCSLLPGTVIVTEMEQEHEPENQN